MPQTVYEIKLRDGVTPGLNNADAAAQRFEGSLAGVNSTLSKIGVTLGAAGVALFGRSMVEAGSKVENAITGLTTLLKDAGEANRVVNQTMEDATKTPFSFETLLTANKALISAGVNAKVAREDVLNLSNAIAATGGGDDELQRMVINLQQIKNTGEATALDIKQFAYAGINLTKVLEEAGLKGANSYEAITEALRKAHEAGGLYYNGLENMAQNTSVKISNLGDALFQLKVKMFNDLKPAIESIIRGMFSFIEAMRKAWDWASRNAGTIKALAVGIGVAVLAFKAMTVIPVILLAIENALVATAAGGVTFGGAMMAALGPVALMAVAIGGLAAVFMKLGENIRSAREANIKFLNESGNRELTYLQTLETDLKGIKTKEQIVADRRAFLRQERDRLQADMNSAKGDRAEQIRLALSENLTRSSTLDSYEQNLVPSKKTSDTATKAAAAGSTKMAPAPKTSAAKAVTINVSINDLIGTFNSNVTNIKNMTGDVKDAVVAALTGAVNDFQITAERS